MAAALTNDVAPYCTSRGSTVYIRSLDAEGAFDAIPHPVLFWKSMDAIPEHCWRLLVRWYSNLTVQIKLGYNLTESINVCNGTRHGGLSSPLLLPRPRRGLRGIVSPGLCVCLSICLSVCVSVCPANILVFYFLAIRRDIDLKFIQDTYMVVLNSLK